MSLKRKDNEEGKIDPSEGIYVEMEGVMEVRFLDEYEDILEKKDFYEFQAEVKRIPANFCHKDMSTGEQAIFFCLVCDCELKSIQPLQSHVMGNKHVRKALAYKQKTLGFEPEPVNQPKKKKIAAPKERVDIIRSLADRLRGHSGPILGLNFIIEFTDPRDRLNPPFYSCTLNGCKSAWGNSDDMFNHVKNHKHLRNFFKNLHPDDDRVDKLTKNELILQGIKKAKELNEMSPESRKYNLIEKRDNSEEYRNISERPKDWSEKKENLAKQGFKKFSSTRGTSSSNANLTPIGYKKRGLFNEEKWKSFTIPTLEEVCANAQEPYKEVMDEIRDDLKTRVKDPKEILETVELNLEMLEIEIEMARECDHDIMDKLIKDLKFVRTEFQDLKREAEKPVANVPQQDGADSLNSSNSEVSAPTSSASQSNSKQRYQDRQKFQAIFKEDVNEVVLQIAKKELLGKSAADIEDITERIVNDKILPMETANFQKKEKQDWSEFKMTDKIKIRIKNFTKGYLDKKYKYLNNK